MFLQYMLVVIAANCENSSESDEFLVNETHGRVDDLSFFDYSSPFCFLLIEFH